MVASDFSDAVIHVTSVVLPSILRRHDLLLNTEEITSLRLGLSLRYFALVVNVGLFSPCACPDELLRLSVVMDGALTCSQVFHLGVLRTGCLSSKFGTLLTDGRGFGVL